MLLGIYRAIQGKIVTVMFRAGQNVPGTSSADQNVTVTLRAGQNDTNKPASGKIAQSCSVNDKMLGQNVTGTFSVEQNAILFVYSRSVSK